MNEDVKELWTEALRSGDYEQGKGSLTNIDGTGTKYFCCLGVLCAVAVANGLDLLVYEDEDRVTYNGASAYLPEAVMEWAGLEQEDPPLLKPETDNEYWASTWNDVHNTSFNRIADLIDNSL